MAVHTYDVNQHLNRGLVAWLRPRPDLRTFDREVAQETLDQMAADAIAGYPLTLNRINPTNRKSPAETPR